MYRHFFSKIGRSQILFKFKSTTKVAIVILFCCGLMLKGCGQAYFPIELNIKSRSERNDKQENILVELIPLNNLNANKANRDPYKRRIIDAGNLEKPAKIIPEGSALLERFPTSNDPGPYLIGEGDLITVSKIYVSANGIQSLIKREIMVKENGFINISEIGSVKAEGLTQSELEDIVYRRMVEEGQDTNFEINISSFNSKKVVVIMDGMPSASIPYSSIPMYLEQLLIEQKIVTSSGIDHSITLSRDGEEYYFSFDRLMRNAKPKYRLFPNDKVFIKKLNYKPETILIIGETGQQRNLPIDAFQRPTLSDAIFSVPVLNSITSDFSQIYVLRKKKDFFRAFHLDITNPTRVSLASKFEMRPDDIVFVATQPLSLYSRTLSQILGSTGLTLQARDTVRTEFGN